MYTINVYGSPYLARFSAGGQNDQTDHNPLLSRFLFPHMFTFSLVNANVT